MSIDSFHAEFVWPWLPDAAINSISTALRLEFTMCHATGYVVLANVGDASARHDLRA